MGAWGPGIFANDDAAGWALRIADSADVGELSAALAEAAEASPRWLEAPSGSIALAAAEVVAAMIGRPSSALPHDLADWVAMRRDAVGPHLVDLANRAVAAVVQDTGQSELRQLWDDAAPDDRSAWLAAVADLKSRLD